MTQPLKSLAVWPFSSEQQANRALSALFAEHSPDLWTHEGPSARAAEFLTDPAGVISEVPLKRDERLLLSAAADLWDGAGRIRFVDLLEMQPSTFLAFFSFVFVCFGGDDHIDRWTRGREARAEP